MFESYFEFDYAAVTVFVSVIMALLLQLWLCFKIKRTFIKLIPIALLIVSTIVFYICAVAINGWDGLGYLFFAFLSFGLIFVCGIGWGIWAIFRNKEQIK